MSNKKQLPEIKGDVYIFSTLTNDQVYANYKLPVGSRQQRLVAEKINSKNGIFIEGGANLRKIADRSIVTPKGVMTKVSQDEYKYLCRCAGFVDHFEGGYIAIEAKEHKATDVAKNMKAKDKSAQKTKGDFKDGEAPKVGKET